MKEMNKKIEFDLDIFVKELSKFNMNFPAKENPSFRTRDHYVKSNLALPSYGLQDNINYNNLIYWKAYIGSLNKEEFLDLLSDRLTDGEFTYDCSEATNGCHNYTVVKKTFSKIHKSLKYIPLVSARDAYPWAAESIIEFGYLYSEKTNLSFLMVYTTYDGDTCLFPIKCFKKIKKNEIKQFHSLIFNYYDKYRDFYARTGRAGSCNEVLLNNNYKWDLKQVEKFFKKFMKYKKEDEKDYNPNWAEEYKSSPGERNEFARYYNIYIFLVKEEKFYKNFSFKGNWRNEIKRMFPFT